MGAGWKKGRADLIRTAFPMGQSGAAFLGVRHAYRHKKTRQLRLPRRKRSGLFLHMGIQDMGIGNGRTVSGDH